MFVCLFIYFTISCFFPSLACRLCLDCVQIYHIGTHAIGTFGFSLSEKPSPIVKTVYRNLNRNQHKQRKSILMPAMDRDALVPVGAFVIISFLLFGLIVMGCMLYWNWSHRKQRSAEGADNISNGNPCIYEKSNPRAYHRSSTKILPFYLRFYFQL